MRKSMLAVLLAVAMLLGYAPMAMAGEQPKATEATTTHKALQGIDGLLARSTKSAVTTTVDVPKDADSGVTAVSAKTQKSVSVTVAPFLAAAVGVLRYALGACSLGWLAGSAQQAFFHGWVWNEVRRAGKEGCVWGMMTGPFGPLAKRLIRR